MPTHTNSIIPESDNVEQVLYYQPIEAALSAYLYNPSSLKMSIKIPDNDEKIPDEVINGPTVNMILDINLPSIEIFFMFSYALGDYNAFNKYISSSKTDDRILNWQRDSLDRLMDMLPRLENDLIVFRGTNKKSKDLVSLNDRASYISTTASIKVANYFKNDDWNSNSEQIGTLFCIKLKKGTKFLPMYLLDSGLGNEWELLIDRRIKFKLIKTYKDKIYMESIPNDI
jgi:hypothetical protein